jgi:nucleotide-binding universal stress UspA family protein
MYKHLLITTDGSDLSMKAAAQGIELAKAVGAKLTALMVTAPWRSIAVGEVAAAVPEDIYERHAREGAVEMVGKVKKLAADAGLACDTVHASHAHAWEAILDTAKKRECDLVVMGSHGRRGIAGFLLGSETVKVLTHSKIPVLVYRE